VAANVLPNVPVRDVANQLVTGGGGINMPSVTPLVSNVANVAGGGVGDVAPSFFDKAGSYLNENKQDLLMKAAGQFMGGNQPAGPERYDEPMMDPIERERLEREALMRELMMGGGERYRPTSRYSARWI
jgi:hypothetical protein